MTTNERMVREGYGDCFGASTRNLTFHTTYAPGKVIAPLCALVGEYNEYDGPRAAATVSTIDARFPGCLFAFGRENSPVLYIKPSRLSTSPDIMEYFLDWADEVDQEDDFIRIWWD